MGFLKFDTRFSVLTLECVGYTPMSIGTPKKRKKKKNPTKIVTNHTFRSFLGSIFIAVFWASGLLIPGAALRTFCIFEPCRWPSCRTPRPGAMIYRWSRFANTHTRVSINRGTPKWMVFIRENPTKMDDLGVPLFQETSNISYIILLWYWTLWNSLASYGIWLGFWSGFPYWLRRLDRDNKSIHRKHPSMDQCVCFEHDGT